MAISITSAISQTNYSAYNRELKFVVSSDAASNTNFKFKVELYVSAVSVLTVYLPATSINSGTGVLTFYPSHIIKRFITETTPRLSFNNPVLDESNGYVCHSFKFSEYWDGAASPASVLSSTYYAHNSIEDFGTSTTKKSVLLSRDVKEIFHISSRRELSFFIDGAFIDYYYVKATIYKGAATRIVYLQGDGKNEILKPPASGRITVAFDEDPLSLTTDDTAFKIEVINAYSLPPSGTGTVSTITSVSEIINPKQIKITTDVLHGFSAGDPITVTYTPAGSESAPLEGYFFVAEVISTTQFVINFPYADYVAPPTRALMRVQKLTSMDSPAEGELNSSAYYTIIRGCYEDIMFKNRLGGFDVQTFIYMKESSVQITRDTYRSYTGYFVTGREALIQRTYGGVFVENQDKVIDLLTSGSVMDMDGNALAIVNSNHVLEQFNSLTNLEITVKEKYLTINE